MDHHPQPIRRVDLELHEVVPPTDGAELEVSLPEPEPLEGRAREGVADEIIGQCRRRLAPMLEHRDQSLQECEHRSAALGGEDP